ncbi:MAG: riboflavin biosynthesis protein RibF [Planctomycetota bacterium]
MRVLHGLASLTQRAAGPEGLASRAVVCVGVFDGVHLGHQRLLHELVEMAARLGAVPTVVTFAEHPGQLLRGEAPPMLVSVPHRLRLLRRAGVETVLLLDFAEVRELSAAAFARQVLSDGLRAIGFLLGYDSALGRDREGDAATMRDLGRELGFDVQLAARFEIEGGPVSSTRIRTAIGAGDLATAHRLLGRWPSALGTVVRGDGRGAGLGFPTANLASETPTLPPEGVYAAIVLHEGEPRPAVANLGRRPTIGDGGTEARLEVHLLDFEGDLYGAKLEVCFQARLRDEQRFADLDALCAQIGRDAARARELLGS